MSEWQGMRKQPNTKLRDLLKTGQKRLAKLKKMLDTLTRQKKRCNALNNALKCVLTTFKNQSLKVFNGTDD